MAAVAGRRLSEGLGLTRQTLHMPNMFLEHKVTPMLHKMRHVLSPPCRGFRARVLQYVQCGNDLNYETSLLHQLSCEKGDKATQYPSWSRDHSHRKERQRRCLRLRNRKLEADPPFANPEWRFSGRDRCDAELGILHGLVVGSSDGGMIWRGASCVRPNVRAKPTVEADAGWPRKDDIHSSLERPDGGCRSGSAP